MTTVFSSIICGEPKTAESTFPSLLEVLRVPILGCLLKYSISLEDMEISPVPDTASSLLHKKIWVCYCGEKGERQRGVDRSERRVKGGAGVLLP